MPRIWTHKARVVLALLVTIAVLHFVANRVFAVAVLALSWSFLFAPFSTGELVAFVLAAFFFLLQNYVCLRAGLFEFRFKDVLLMPYYEPLLWGFYFISMKRFITGPTSEDIVIDKKSVAGVVLTSVAFSLFSFDSRALFVATACSTTFLFFLFHSKIDLYYASYGLMLGVIIELFGVSTGLWWYPAPDFLGIPYWFATMWISVGLLGRRFLIPASETVARNIRRSAGVSAG
ncbi:MAG TPA: hypothetical protein VL225_13635 [Vicinamibacterales bacterium]|nr:hypothetical protein [Vicinamibacterales bacterium]